LIHPIAGKCKHCKADLSSYRAQRPQAAAQLPSLAAPAAAPPPVVVPASGPVPTPVMPNGNGHASEPVSSPWAPPALQAAYMPPTAASPAQPPPLAQMHEQAQAVLPQRPAGMSWTHMQKQAPQSSPWRSWPMLVIILAMIAIVTAVVIMVWPSSSRADGKNGLEPPPAPEKMNTKPTDNNTDPWGASSGQLDPPSKDAVLAQISKHICDRALTCTNHTLRDLCGSDAIHGSIPQTCTAATDRCLAHVDSLACSAPLDDADALEGLLAQVPECVEAIHC
jgi:hypothetical protein